MSKLSLTLMSWQSHLQWLRADIGWQWRGMWGLWWKETERDLIGCLHVSGENVDACLPSKSSEPIRMCATEHAHRGVILLSWLSALSHTEISIWFKVAGLPCSMKCISNRLYCNLQNWYHLKKYLLINSQQTIFTLQLLIGHFDW